MYSDAWIGINSHKKGYQIQISYWRAVIYINSHLHNNKNIEISTHFDTENTNLREMPMHVFCTILNNTCGSFFNCGLLEIP